MLVNKLKPPSSAAFCEQILRRLEKPKVDGPESKLI